LTNKQLRLQNNVRLGDLSKAVNALWRMYALSSGIKEEEDELVLNAFKGFCL
jgi:hypothetical protein